MKSKIFLDSFYHCKPTSESPFVRSFQDINCKAWSVDTTECKTSCALKIHDSPTPLECAKCEKREPIIDITIKKTELLESPSFIKKTINYAKAETSQIVSGKVSEDIFENRKKICMSCEHLTNPKPDVDPIGWCKGGCGCVVGNPRAGLSQKLYIPSVSCPKNKWGTEKGEGFKISDSLDSIKGIATSVKNLFEKDK
jgi:hypothetical protein